MLKEHFFTEAELANELGKCIRALRVWRQQGKGPSYTKAGSTVLYPRDGVIDWLKSQQVQPVRSRKAA